VSEYLSAALEALAPGAGDARILKDNLPWIERYLRQKLEQPDPVDAATLFAQAAAAMQEQLDLEDGSQDILAADLKRLEGAIEAGGQFLGYGPHSSLHLMSDYLDAGALSGMLGQRAHGSVEMPLERRVRVEQALQDLQAWQDDPVLVRFVGQLDDPALNNLSVLEIIDSDNPCTTATEVFERDAAALARLFAAIRIASLEIDGNYNPAIHDSWFASFDWQAFSAAEMQLVTRVVALVSADYLAGDGLKSFSRLLGSRLPIHVLSWVRAYDNPAAKPGEDPFESYRFELANFGLGHRQVVVAQTSAARHEDLLTGFLTALDSNRASLHLINRGTQTKTKKPLLDAWFVASAALESRAHPFILVNPDAGDHAAERVSFGGNPQADSDWPVEKLEFRGADGELAEMDLAFTFADYALLMPALQQHFRRVPTGFESPDFVSIDEYLNADDELVDRLVPFVWGIDEDDVLTRLVVSRALVFACRDRLNYWHTLQELAGIQNFYVEEAIERIIAEQQAALDAEREQLQKEHNGSPLATMPASEPAIEEAAAEDAAAEPPPPAEEEAEEELSFDEPWLDTAMCTTCDDCMAINKMMFVYNANDVCVQR